MRDAAATSCSRFGRDRVVDARPVRFPVPAARFQLFDLDSILLDSPGPIAIRSSALSLLGAFEVRVAVEAEQRLDRRVPHAIEHARRPAERRRVMRSAPVRGRRRAGSSGSALAVLPGLAPVDRRQAHQLAALQDKATVGAALQGRARAVRSGRDPARRARGFRRRTRSPRSDRCRSKGSRAAPSAWRPPAAGRARASIRGGASVPERERRGAHRARREDRRTQAKRPRRGAATP